MAVKKLIEVALPLEKINEESAREKSIRHGHPSTLHLWWARRPLAAARAVIWASLVDDPSSHPEKFPTEEEQNKERKRLFNILEDLVVWENSNNEKLISLAKEEILKSTNNNPPEFLDPFAGGGAIPLEAQRLGLKAHAHDLNPVAVMINKAMIEIPFRFAEMAPVNPGSKTNNILQTWNRSQGLAEDVRYYGEWMKQEAFKRIGHLYPKVKVPSEQGGGDATVIAWIWARTVKCPNPACGCEMPLVSSFVLSKKKGSEAWIEPILENDKIRYVVRQGICPKEKTSCKLARGAEFKCVKCGAVADKAHIHNEFVEKRNGTVLLAIVAEGKRGRIYLPPTAEQQKIADEAVPRWVPEEPMNVNTPDLISGRGYGITQWKDIFAPRQLTTLTTFSDLVAEAQIKVEKDAIVAGMLDDHIPLREGGVGAKAYGEAVGVYLAFVVDKLADLSNSLNRWEPNAQCPRQLFARQAIPMVWDHAEGNPFSNSSGSWDVLLRNLMECFKSSLFDFYRAKEGVVEQADAQSDCKLRNIMVSTDPPYYDNIGYADLSDFFYVWLRRSLKDTYPELFGTMLVPKAEELIAAPYRHDGSAERAKSFFEDGMLSACKRIYQYSRKDIPVTIYYAYKRSDSDDSGTVSSGWETMLGAIVNAGFAITGTWPVRTECGSRAVAQNSNALASSIILVCRKRQEDAPKITRRNLVNTLRLELRPALKKLQESNIAPVDLAQSAIGPGMGVFSRYKQVLESDGTPMSVGNALKLINEEIDAYFNEQVGDMDADSRFCIDLFSQCAFNDIKYGDAEILATAKSASIPMMVSRGVLYAKSGIVHLTDRSDMTEHVDSNEQCIWKLTQQLTQAMSKGGVDACAKILANMFGSNVEHAKDLAYRLYTIAERKNWTNEAYAYNALVVAWPDIQAKSAELKKMVPEQLDLFSKGSLGQ